MDEKTQRKLITLKYLEALSLVIEMGNISSECKQELVYVQEEMVKVMVE